MRKEFVRLHGSPWAISERDFAVLLDIDPAIDVKQLGDQMQELDRQLRQIVPEIVKIAVRGKHIRVDFKFGSDTLKLIMGDRPGYKSDLVAHLITQTNAILTTLLG